MRGEKVIARAFGGVPVVLRVWEAGQGVVYLSSAVEFQKRETGKLALEPVGFPARDVFTYDEAFLTANGNGKPKWDRLNQWKPYKVLK